MPDFARGGRGGRGRKASERELACHCAVLLRRKFMPFRGKRSAESYTNGKKRGGGCKGAASDGEGCGGTSKIEPGHFAGGTISCVLASLRKINKLRFPSPLPVCSRLHPARPANVLFACPPLSSLSFFLSFSLFLYDTTFSCIASLRRVTKGEFPRYFFASASLYSPSSLWSSSSLPGISYRVDSSGVCTCLIRQQIHTHRAHDMSVCSRRASSKTVY